MTLFVVLYTRVQNRLLTRREDGAAGVEYGLLVALIAAVIIGAVTGIGTKLNTAFGAVESALPH